jgi:site-specific recombinase XerD
MKGKFALRDRALFVLGIRTGYRISELLSLMVRDVFQNGNVADYVYVARGKMKNKKEGRKVILHPEAKAALRAWLEIFTEAYPDPDAFVFRSRQGGNKPMDRRSAWKMLKAAFAACGLTGKLATHSMRKTFVHNIYENTGHDLIATQTAVGHSRSDTTALYLSSDQEKIDEAILKS